MTALERDTNANEKLVKELMDRAQQDKKLISELRGDLESETAWAEVYSEKCVKLTARIAELEAERAALKAQLDEALRVVEAARGVYKCEDTTRELWVDLRDALAAYDAQGAK